MLPKLFLRKNEEFRIKNGHQWIFSNEIAKIEAEAGNGDLVEIYDWKNNLLGTGFYNKNSLISFRLLSYGKINDLSELIYERIRTAYKLRKELYPKRDSFRLAFSESDFLPGVIIDKYNDSCVLQVYSAGMEKNIDLIVKALEQEVKAVNIFSKNEEFFRKLEGLPAEDTTYLGQMTKEIIDDGSVKFRIDFEKSHKTGFYFDQCDNRAFIERIVKGKKVIDAFCNSGGFGLHASIAGASSVTFLDSSSNEIENVKENISLNSLQTNCEFAVSDVFDYFEKALQNGISYDVVMIDPPAFAKNKKSLPIAKKGYEKLNRLALSLVNKEEGFLVTSSCSHHLKKEEFIDMLNTAAAKSGRTVQLIHFNNASLDHPQLPSMEETVYLKFAVLKVSKNRSV
ncbi:MAG: class I SAM-dependent rRNA methyltransferase [Clostridiales bacterium]